MAGNWHPKTSREGASAPHCPPPAGGGSRQHLSAPTGTHGVAALAVGRPLQAVELLSLQLLLTLVAGEAGDVEQLPQSPDRRLRACQRLTTPATGLWEGRRGQK